MTDEDYTEDDRWDWDRNDPRQHCKHGTFIGSWWGPDLMCGACEMGDPAPTVKETLAKAEAKRAYPRDEATPVLLKAYKYCQSFDEQEAWAKTFTMIVSRLEKEAQQLEQFADEIRQWAESDDDNDWLSRKHDAELREYREYLDAQKR